MFDSSPSLDAQRHEMEVSFKTNYPDVYETLINKPVFALQIPQSVSFVISEDSTGYTGDKHGE